MNVVILGGKSKFGLYLNNYLSWFSDNQVLALGKPEIDFSTDWVAKVGMAIYDRFTHSENIDLIIVNAFDHRSEYASMQRNIFQTVWKLYKDNPRTTILVIGSICHHEPERNTDLYVDAKRTLARMCAHLSLSEHQCKLILLEPGPMENRIGLQTIPRSVLPFAEVAALMTQAIDMNLPYLQIGMRGPSIKDYMKLNPTTNKEENTQ